MQPRKQNSEADMKFYAQVSEWADKKTMHKVTYGPLVKLLNLTGERI